MIALTRRRLWFGLFVTVVFLLGVAVGIGAARFFHLGPPFGRGRPPGRPPSPAAIAERMTRELGLSSEQQQRLQEVFRQGEERMQQLQTTTREQFDAERARLDADIEQVLTPEQQTKYRQLRPRPRIGPPGPPPPGHRGPPPGPPPDR